ncbi:uncharacterized protein BYT42DRAFT_579621 [Radiomyces spectabilis]|uniref:uncharacterized protein n=1 Tax=Radiomyces spectabilis TaxID=64574 RepID=UPI00221EED48|nr:uncharacterized protein BYT42DRAFT_579621 [Radiomyces spectabilis]KAI8373217.1 hypothetical protein BYT42DRAFT_579621 [Radiomyces spectabilis]
MIKVAMTVSLQPPPPHQQLQQQQNLPVTAHLPAYQHQTIQVSHQQFHEPLYLPQSVFADVSFPAVIYGGRGVTPQMGVAGAIFIILGIYLMVFGFRAFRPTLGVCGFITFGIVTWVGMANSQPANGYINEPITLIAVPAGLGVLGAILYVFFWNVSIYLVGGLGGLALALYICCWKENLLIVQEVARACFLVALPFFMACITFFVERYVILFSTSFVGAYIFILGVDFLAHTGYLAGIRSILDRNPLHRVRYTITRTVIAMLAVTIVLFLISLAWQYLYNRNRHFGVNIVPVKAAPPPAAEEAGEAEAPPAEGAGEGEPPKA